MRIWVILEMALKSIHLQRKRISICVYSIIFSVILFIVFITIGNGASILLNNEILKHPEYREIQFFPSYAVKNSQVENKGFFNVTENTINNILSNSDVADVVAIYQNWRAIQHFYVEGKEYKPPFACIDGRDVRFSMVSSSIMDEIKVNKPDFKPIIAGREFKTGDLMCCVIDDYMANSIGFSSFNQAIGKKIKLVYSAQSGRNKLELEMKIIGIYDKELGINKGADSNIKIYDINTKFQDIGSQGLIVSSDVINKIATEFGDEEIKYPTGLAYLTVVAKSIDKVQKVYGFLSKTYGNVNHSEIVKIHDVLNNLKTFRWIIIIISILVFIVSLINIINAMLMNVLDNRQYIGIMMTVGFGKIKVLIMFCIQSIIIGFISSTIAGFISYTICILFDSILKDSYQKISNMNFVFIPDPGLICLCIICVCAITGIVGIIPSRQASKIEPVEVLRHE